MTQQVTTEDSMTLDLLRQAAGPTLAERLIPAAIEGRLVLGATGGYLIGFVLASGIVGWLAERRWDRRLPGAFGAMLLGNAVIYLVGLPWLAAAAGFSADETIAKGLLPFLI